MTRTKSLNGTVTDYSTLTRANRRFEWHEMERQDKDSEGEMLRVKLQHLTASELDAIPVDNTPVKDVLQEFRRYIVAWNVTGLNDAGEEVPIPPPAEVENVSDLVTHLLTHDEMVWLYNELRFGHILKVAREKKALTQFGTTPASSPDPDSTNAT